MRRRAYVYFVLTFILGIVVGGAGTAPAEPAGGRCAGGWSAKVGQSAGGGFVLHPLSAGGGKLPGRAGGGEGNYAPA